MKEETIIRRLMKMQGITMGELAYRCGWKYASDVENKFKGSMQVKSLCRMLEGLGCELIIRAGHYDYVVGGHPKERWEPKEEIVFAEEGKESVIVKEGAEVNLKSKVPVYEYGRKKW